MEANPQVLLDWHLLKAWATAKLEGAELGETCTNSACPVANYLGEMTHKLWSVGPAIKSMNGENRERLDKPAWVNTLINRVDDLAGGGLEHQNVPVTREQFLKCLEEVKPQE